MLADPKATALTENFAGQWLYLRNLAIKDASTLEFPDFDDNLRNSFRRETELLFEHVMRNDSSVLELLTADYTFVDERLAKHYGIPGVYGSEFRKVTIADPRRQGLLGHGSILLVTSNPNRTSPVNRGVWVLKNILGAVVPAPPPVNIPPLEEAAGDVDFDSLSVRELMELHRSKPFCEGCHKIMDPIGLAMENFDVIGRWRTVDNGTPIDTAGQLVDGTHIDGPVELRAALLKYEEQIVRNVAEKLLIYAVGRGTEYYDQPVIRRIVRNAAAEDYRFSSLVLGVVMSEPFLRARDGESRRRRRGRRVARVAILRSRTMFIAKKHLPRRTFLRGIGATIALPLLDAMLPAGTALANTAAKPRTRYSFVHLPHGAIMGQFTPKSGRQGLRHHADLGAVPAVPEPHDGDQQPRPPDGDVANAGGGRAATTIARRRCS